MLFDYEERGQADAVANAFFLYDWARKGHIGRSEFVRAASRCGFLFTPQEYRLLMSEFVSDDGVNVSYLGFLEWASPTRPAAARLGFTTHAGEHAHNVIGSKLTEAWNRGVNLAAMFKYVLRRDVVAMVYCFRTPDLCHVGGLIYSGATIAGAAGRSRHRTSARCWPISERPGWW